MYGKITKIVHRDAQPKYQREASVVDIYYDHPSGTVDKFHVGNQTWHVSNPWLQFCAVYGWQPTQLSEPLDSRENQYGQRMNSVNPQPTVNVSDRDRYLPLTRTPDGIIVPDLEQVFDGAREKLAQADWFDPELDGTDGDDGGGPPGGGSSDPGTGNRGGVDVESLVQEIEDSDSDTEVIEI